MFTLRIMQNLWYNLWENAELLNVKVGGTNSYHWALKGRSLEVLYKFFISSACATCPYHFILLDLNHPNSISRIISLVHITYYSHLILHDSHLTLHDLIILTISGEKFKLWSSSLCKLLHPSVTSFSGLNILFSILFWNILNLCSSLRMRDQVAHPYTTDNITVLYLQVLR
jgi:hypothetical protein